MSLHRTGRLLSIAFVAAASAGCEVAYDAPDAGPCEGTDANGNATLCVPAKDEGFQLATPVFDVPGGHEVQNCYFFRVPAKDDVFVKRLFVAQNTGSHHMNLFRVASDNALSHGADDGTLVAGEDGAGECFNSANWSDWPLVINSQQSSNAGDTGTIDWTLPSSPRGQVVDKFAPGELLMLQTHYVNATTQTSALGKGKVLVDFYFADAGTKGPILTTIFATHPSIEIRPDLKGDQSFDAACNFKHPDVTIVGANSHFHSRGVDFTIETGTKDGSVDEQFYENTRWDDPLMAFDLKVPLAADDPLLYTCTYRYPTAVDADHPCPSECEPLDTPNPACGNGAQCEKFMFTPHCANSFCFGPLVETMEHCNMFVYLYANDADASFEGAPITCF